jgi:glucose-6-phosphate 1-dehydrogenase
VKETQIIGYARSDLSEERLNEQLFWKVQDDVKEGHREADEGKMKEFRAFAQKPTGQDQR